MESIFNFSRINRVSQGGVQIGCSPPWKNFSVKNLKGGTKVKTYSPLDFLRNLRENLKGSKDIFWTKFRNVSFGLPFEISTEFRQKSLKNCDFH
jgi:hypothetical protein